jgi:HD-like signal output (HDOD) protein
MTLSEFDATQLINKIDSLPTLPTIYYRLLEVMNNPRSTAIDVADVITKDQASAAKVLKAANSPIYGFYGRIENITQAISYIGFEEVKNLVTAITIIDFFNEKFSNQGINPIEFWKHSIAVGIITRLIGKHTRVNDLENYFLAGILHDIGKIALVNLIPEIYATVYKYSSENNISHKDAEYKILGITHNVVGEILATKWNLPLSIRNSIRYHENGIVENSFKSIVATTHIANITAMMFGLGFDDFIPIPEPNRAAWEVLNLNDDFFTLSNSMITVTYSDSVNMLLKPNGNH